MKGAMKFYRGVLSAGSRLDVSYLDGKLLKYTNFLFNPSGVCIGLCKLIFRLKFTINQQQKQMYDKLPKSFLKQIAGIKEAFFLE
jgi:hypothetical protein